MSRASAAASSASKKLLFIAAKNPIELKEASELFYGDDSLLRSQTTEFFTSARKAKEDEEFQARLAESGEGEFDYALILTHGEARNRSTTEETHHAPHLDILAQAQSLAAKGISNQHVVTCQGGALVHDLARKTAEFAGLDLTIYSSSKYGVTNALKSFIGRTSSAILREAEKEESLTIVRERITGSAETIIFASVSEAGELSAVKFRNPKEPNPAKGREGQLWAFDDPDSLIKYYETEALVPVYLNELDASGNRISLPVREELVAAATAEIARMRALPADEKETIFRSQLKYSLLKAADNGKTETITKIAEVAVAIGAGEEVLNSQDEVGSTPLIWTAVGNNPEALDTLLATGRVDLNQANNLGGTALMLAALNGFSNVISKLCESGAAVNDPVNKYGGTSLTYALMLDGNPENPEKAENKKLAVESLLKSLAREKTEAESRGEEFELKGTGVGDGKSITESLRNYALSLAADNSRESESIVTLTQTLGIDLEEERAASATSASVSGGKSWVTKMEERAAASAEAEKDGRE